MRFQEEFKITGCKFCLLAAYTIRSGFQDTEWDYQPSVDDGQLDAECSVCHLQKEARSDPLA